MRYLSSLVLVLFLACSSELEEKKILNEAGQLEEIQHFSSKTGQPEGQWIKYYPNGLVYEEALYNDGLLHGLRKLYDQEGNLEIVEQYENGNYEGEYLRYYPNGTLKIAGVYQNNVMTGDWKVFYEDGTLKEIVQFQNNLENGPFEEYYPNGKPKAKGTYLEGEHEHGKLELFDEEGQLERIMECNKGLCQTVWRKDSDNQN